MTNKELGDLIGVGESMASRLRKGQRRPSWKVAIKLQEQLDIPLDHIMGSTTKKLGRMIETELKSR